LSVTETKLKKSETILQTPETLLWTMQMIIQKTKTFFVTPETG